MSRNHVGEQTRWRMTRAIILARDRRTCRKCGKYWGKLEVDHIKPLHQGGARWASGNLQTLCVGCHIEKTRAENRRTDIAGRADWLRRMDRWR